MEELTPEEAAFVDRYIADLAREEQDAIDRKHGEAILGAIDASKSPERNDALLEILGQAWQSKLEEAKPREPEK